MERINKKTWKTAGERSQRKDHYRQIYEKAKKSEEVKGETKKEAESSKGSFLSRLQEMGKIITEYEYKREERDEKTQAAAQFLRELLDFEKVHDCLSKPIECLRSSLGQDFTEKSVDQLQEKLKELNGCVESLQTDASGGSLPLEATASIREFTDSKYEQIKKQKYRLKSIILRAIKEKVKEERMNKAALRSLFSMKIEEEGTINTEAAKVILKNRQTKPGIIDAKAALENMEIIIERVKERKEALERLFETDITSVETLVHDLDDCAFKI